MIHEAGEGHTTEGAVDTPISSSQNPLRLLACCDVLMWRRQIMRKHKRRRWMLGDKDTSYNLSTAN